MSRIEKARDGVGRLQQQLDAKRQELNAAKVTFNQLVATWRELTLAQDIDGADHAKSIVENESAQDVQKRTMQRLQMAITELERRLKQAQTELQRIEYEAELQRLQTLGVEQAALHQRLDSHLSEIVPAILQIFEMNEQRDQLYGQLRTFAAAKGFEMPQRPDLQVPGAIVGGRKWWTFIGEVS